MKKIIFVAAFVMAAGVSAQAQEQKFCKWTVTPRVGFNVSNLVEGNAPGKDSKLGFTGGADVEYRPVKFLGVSLGCYFNTQNSSVDLGYVYEGNTSTCTVERVTVINSQYIRFLKKENGFNEKD